MRWRTPSPSANLERSLGELPAEADDPESVIDGVIDALWAGIRESRGPQLLSYELTTSSLRHPELNQVAIEQYRGQWAAAEQVLDLRRAVRRTSAGRSRAARSRARSSRSSTASRSPGSSTATSEAARAGLQGFGRFLATVAVPTSLDAGRRRPATTCPRERALPSASPRRPARARRRSPLGFAAPGVRPRHDPDEPRRRSRPVRHRRRRRSPSSCSASASWPALGTVRRRPGRPRRRGQPGRRSARASLDRRDRRRRRRRRARLRRAGLVGVRASTGVGLGMVDAGTNMQAVAVQRDYGRSLLTGLLRVVVRRRHRRRRLRRGHGRPRLPTDPVAVALLAGTLVALLRPSACCAPAWRDGRRVHADARRDARRGPGLPPTTAASPSSRGGRARARRSASSRTTSSTHAISDLEHHLPARRRCDAAGSVAPLGYAAYLATTLASRLVGDPAVRRWGRVRRGARRVARRRRRAAPRHRRTRAVGRPSLGFAVAGAGLGAHRAAVLLGGRRPRARARRRGRRAAQRLQLRRSTLLGGVMVGAIGSHVLAPDRASPSRRARRRRGGRSPAGSASPGTPTHPSHAGAGA